MFQKKNSSINQISKKERISAGSILSNINQNNRQQNLISNQKTNHRTSQFPVYDKMPILKLQTVTGEQQEQYLNKMRQNKNLILNLKNEVELLQRKLQKVTQHQRQAKMENENLQSLIKDKEQLYRENDIQCLNKQANKELLIEYDRNLREIMSKKMVIQKMNAQKSIQLAKGIDKLKQIKQQQIQKKTEKQNLQVKLKQLRQKKHNLLQQKLNKAERMAKEYQIYQASQKQNQELYQKLTQKEEQKRQSDKINQTTRENLKRINTANKQNMQLLKNLQKKLANATAQLTKHQSNKQKMDQELKKLNEIEAQSQNFSNQLSQLVNIQEKQSLSLQQKLKSLCKDNQNLSSNIAKKMSIIQSLIK